MAFTIKVNGAEFGCSGGFGRRLHVDGINQAARFARQVDGPVEVVTMREGDIQHYDHRSSCSFADGVEGGRR